MKSLKYIFKICLLITVLGFTAVSCAKKEEPISEVTENDQENEEEEENKDDDNDENFETLVFTPNESFFSPVGTLRANQRDKTTGNIYNKGEYYDYIYKWKNLNDTIVFGINIKTPGSLIIKPEMGVIDNQDGSEMYIYLGDERKELSLKATGSKSNYQIQNEVTFENVNVGFYEIKLQLKSLKNPSSDIGNFKNLHITGKAATSAENEMRRYRAFAVHAKWKTASNNPVEISVHELSIANKNIDYYQPITTPFGYTGSTWKKNTQTFGGYNFSLWSYGANDPVPPFYQESHLIAVGPGLEFGTYGHEGTGVKPRGPHPYIGKNTSTQVIAVRKDPGTIYDTYWSYYLDPDTNHWKLYGCGRKYNKSGQISHLWTGAFVEVPGAASVMRNGHRTAETHYKGWQMDTSGNWHPVNTMEGTTGQNNESFRDWNIVDNKFSMKMGGWGEPGIEKKTLTLSNPEPLPDFLKNSYVDELYKMPATFTHNSPVEILSTSAKLSFNVTDLGTNATATIFWGTEEGLTKEDKWQQQKSISVSAGNNVVELTNLNNATDYYYRVKIKNNEGIIWSLNTQEFKTAD